MSVIFGCCENCKKCAASDGEREEKIKSLREQGWTDKKIADALRICRAAVSRVLYGGE